MRNDWRMPVPDSRNPYRRSGWRVMAAALLLA